MGKRGIILAIILLMYSSLGRSQELSHQVLVPAAGIISTSSADLSQTVGETAVTIIAEGDFILTQGFQQPSFIPETGTKPLGNGVNAYPNPVTDKLTIEFFGEVARSYTVSIMNVYGVVVYSTTLEFPGPYWYKLEKQVDSYTPGLYLVHISSSDRAVKKTIKIEKM
ncbi:MAG: T9SS type A sorting domain-containing protein [Bacteroidales bacterium]